MKKYQLISVLLFFLTFSLPVYAGSSYQVTFETQECNGDTGMGTAEISDIFRIQSMECDPPHEGVKLKQVIVKSSKIRGSYDVFTVTPESAAMIQKEIREYMSSKKRLLDRGKSIILHQTRD